MLNRIKSYLTLLSILVAILSGFYGFYSSVKSDRLKIERDNLQDELLVKTTEVVIYTNKLGQQVTKTIEYQKSLEQLKNSSDSIEQQLYKTLKASSLKDKQIKSLTKIIVDGNGGGSYTLIDTLWKHDTLYIGTIKTYNDNFISITCMEDSLKYVTHLELELFTASRLVPRNIQPFKWINKKWELHKMTGKNQVEVITNVPNSELIIRQINTK